MNMEPDRGVLEDGFLLKGPPVRFHVSCWEASLCRETKGNINQGKPRETKELLYFVIFPGQSSFEGVFGGA